MFKPLYTRTQLFSLKKMQVNLKNTTSIMLYLMFQVYLIPFAVQWKNRMESLRVAGGQGWLISVMDSRQILRLNQQNFSAPMPYHEHYCVKWMSLCLVALCWPILTSYVPLVPEIYLHKQNCSLKYSHLFVLKTIHLYIEPVCVFRCFQVNLYEF